jgi:hypothetical protein
MHRRSYRQGTQEMGILAADRRRRTRPLLALAALTVTFLGGASVAQAATGASDPHPAVAPAASKDATVFTDRNVRVVVSGGTATAINACLNDATDGVIQKQKTACRQAASAGDLVSLSSITVYQSKNSTITVTGGTAKAINRCVNDATDGVIQKQQNACRQASSAGNVVVVAEIAITASKNITVTVTGGSATATDECINNATGGSDQHQQNACIQVADAGNLVDVGDIVVSRSKNITIDITGGIAVTVFTCTNHASSSEANQQDACRQTAVVGNTTSLGNVKVTDSKNITVTLDGKVVTTIDKQH